MMRPRIEYHHSTPRSWGGKAIKIAEADGTYCREGMLVLIEDMDRDVREKLEYLREHGIEDLNLVEILERLERMASSGDFQEVFKTTYKNWMNSACWILHTYSFPKMNSTAPSHVSHLYTR